MPEHETYDLDAAFAALEQDISTLSTSPGAGAAVARARRRRRTTVGAIAGATVLVVGGAVVGQGWSVHDDAVAPADQLPAPALLDGPHLSKATEGWTPAWSTNNQQARLKMGQTFGGGCLMVAPRGRSGIAVLGNSHGDVAAALMSDYGTHAAEEQHDWRGMERRLAACSGAQLVSSFSDPSGAVGHTYRLPATQSGTAPEYEWIVSTGQGIGVLKIFDQSDELPAANNRPVADALLAAVQDPSSYDQQGTTPPGGVQRIDPAKTLGQVWSEALTPALVGWSTPWDPRLPLADGGSPPSDPACTAGFLKDPSGSSQTVNVGTDGHEWVQWFDSESGATQALEQVQRDLKSCATPYAFHTVTLPDGRPILVGVGPQVFWATRVASHILVLAVPAGDTPPPDEVSLKVGALLEHVLEQPAATTVSPDGHTKVPEWMQKEIAAAPTFGP